MRFNKGQKGKCKLNQQALNDIMGCVSFDLRGEIFDYDVVYLGRMDITSPTYNITFRVNPLNFDDNWIEV
jgi:hypothetical protein